NIFTVFLKFFNIFYVFRLYFYRKINYIIKAHIFIIRGILLHAHQLKDGYKTKFCSFELKSPQMGGFIKNKHAK
ncbi:hypothetical protein P4H72_15385, partial [Bacillus cereus]|nr:hypothetical protein [Bacillus cereus]